MAEVMRDGFETLPLQKSMWATSPVSVSTGTGRTGVGKSMVGGGGAAQAHIAVLPTPLPQLILGEAFFCANSAFGTLQTGSAWGIYGDVNATLHLTLHIDATGHLTLRRGAIGGTIIATSALTIVPSAWHYIEVKATVADAGGICIVKVDGTEHLNFTGDTKNAGTLTTISGFAIPAYASGGAWQHDDLYVLDNTGPAPYNDFIGERIIRAIRPNGNGASSQWTGSDADQVNNWDLTEEDPISQTDYVAAASAGLRDLYDFTNLTGMASVDSLQVFALAAKTDAGARAVRTLGRSAGGTVSSSADLTLSTTPTLVQGALRTLDADGLPWTVASANAHQLGVESV